MKSNRIQLIEQYARQVMDEQLTGDLGLAHNYGHVDRVRNWAVKLAKAEGFADLEMVETAALLHDIGLAFVTERRLHGEVGAEKTAEFLRSRQLFPEEQISEICEAVRCHCEMAGGGLLGGILRDGDILDLLGAMGIMRGCMSQYSWQEYDPARVKGVTWGITAVGMTARFQAGLGTGPTSVDHLNFQISCYENLQSEAARLWGRPLVAYMQAFLMQLEQEVDMDRN
jgi:hypothetical protein